MMCGASVAWGGWAVRGGLRARSVSCSGGFICEFFLFIFLWSLGRVGGLWARDAQCIPFYVSGRLWEVHLFVFPVFGGGVAGARFWEPNVPGGSGGEGPYAYFTPAGLS